MFERLLKEYGYEMRLSGRLSAASVAAYTSDLKDYARYLESRVASPRDIDADTVRGYLATLRKKHMSAASVTRKLSAIRGFHQYMLNEKLIDENVVLRVRPPKKKVRLPDVLSIEEIERLLAASKGTTPLHCRNTAMIELLYGSGLRISELLDLRLDALHVNQGFINVTGKGGKERIVPIGTEAAKALKVYLESGREALSKARTPFVFLNRLGRPIGRVGFYKIIKSLAVDAGIDKDVSPHTLRHSFATHLIEAGVEIRYVQEMLGHEHVATTEIYTHLSRSTLIDIYDKYHPHAKKQT